MMTYKPFSIVVVPFPFTDSPQTKRRPALVLSTEEYQKQTKHIILLMVTSAKNPPWSYDHKIQDLASTTLSAESVVRQKVFTLDIRLIINCIGKLSKKDKEAVIKQTKKQFGF